MRGVAVAEFGAELARIAQTYPEARVEFEQSGTAVLYGVPTPRKCAHGFAILNQSDVWVIQNTGFGWVVERNPDGTESERGRWYNRIHV